MTDKQLAIVLRGIQRQLQDEIAVTTDRLWEAGFPRPTEREHIPAFCLRFGCADPTHWADVPVDHIEEMWSLANMADSLMTQIEMLERTESVPA